MDIKIDSNFLKNEHSLKRLISNFDSKGQTLVKGNRNQIKVFNIDGVAIAIKSFKIPNPFNKLIYKYFRKSKADRSYEYAKILLNKNIGTPQPIGSFKKFDETGLLDSYYISEYLHADFTFRELNDNLKFPDHKNILKQFTRFTFELHEKGIEFLDHSAGNTLIKKTSSEKYDFFLVDLNRMKFHKTISFNKRMKNLRKLTFNKEIIKIISEEYAILSGRSKESTFQKLWRYTLQFNLNSQILRKIKGIFKDPKYY